MRSRSAGTSAGLASRSVKLIRPAAARRVHAAGQRGLRRDAICSRLPCAIRSELRYETHVPEGAVEPERPAGARVLLAVRLAAGLRIDPDAIWIRGRVVGVGY